MATPEGKVKDRVKRLLKKYDCYQFWAVQTGFGAPTLDCLGCCNGNFFAVETKAPGKTLTPRQELTRDDIEAANGPVFVVGRWKKGQEIGGKGTGLFCEEEYSGLGELEAWLLMVSA